MEKMAGVQVTDRDGKFQISIAKPVDSLHLELRAKDFASRLFNKVSVRGDDIQTLQMQRGVTVAGRVLNQGKPQGNVVLGIVWSVRNSGTFWGPWEVLTDNEGRFTINNVTPERQVYLYGKMASLRGIGAIEQAEFETGPDEGTLKIGDIKLVPGHKISGKVLLSDGKPLSPGSRINLAQKDHWDSQSFQLPPDGKFEFQNVPPCVCSFTVIVPSLDGKALSAYHLSPLNQSLDPAHVWNLIGRVDSDTHLLVTMEPGEPKDPEMPNTEPQVGILKAKHQELQTGPLRGIPTDSDAK